MEQSEPKFMASMSATPLNPTALRFHLNRLISKTSPQAKNSVSDVQQGIIAPSDVPYQLEFHEKSFKEVMAMQ